MVAQKILLFTQWDTTIFFLCRKLVIPQQVGLLKANFASCAACLVRKSWKFAFSSGKQISRFKICICCFFFFKPHQGGNTTSCKHTICTLSASGMECNLSTFTQVEFWNSLLEFFNFMRLYSSTQLHFRGKNCNSTSIYLISLVTSVMVQTVCCIRAIVAHLFWINLFYRQLEKKNNTDSHNQKNADYQIW